MNHNTDPELFQPFTCTTLFACTELFTGPETQTTPEPIGFELSVLGAALKRVKERRAQTQTAPLLPALDAQQEHALAQVSASLAEREHALVEREQTLAKREDALRVTHKSFVEKTRIQQDHEKLLHQMQTVIEESNRKVIAWDNERKLNQEKLDAQKNKQDEMMEALKDWGVMCNNRSAALDERQRMLETTSREQETHVNAMEEV
jgi:hypothetical protein